MATLQQLEDGLRKAHAAGNADHARAFAAEIRKMREQPRADFSNVRGGSRTTETADAPDAQYADIQRKRRLEFTPEEVAEFNPVEKFAFGLQNSINRLPLGIAQVGASAADYFMRQNPALGGAEATGRLVARLEGEEARRRAATAPVTDTAAAKAGGFVGDLATAVVPVARASRLAMPQQIAANAATGVGLGAIQPVTPNESRGGNMLLGGALSGGGTVLAPVVGRVAGAAARPFRAFTERGANTQAANLLRRSATDAAALTRSAPSPVPGVQRTLAEETLDPGIGQLQRQYPQQLAGISEANDMARVGYIRGAFGGASPQAAQAQRAATQAAQGPAIAAAKRETGAQSGRVVSWLDRITNSTNYRGNTDVSGAVAAIRSRIVNPIDDAGRLSAARSVVAESLKSPKRMSAADFDKVTEARRLVLSAQRSGAKPDEVAAALAKLKPSSATASGIISDMRRALRTAEKGKDDVATLYETRKHITGKLIPKALKANDGATAQVLSGAVQRLDEQITAVAPTYRQYLTDYRAGMQVADQITTGANILKRGTAQGVRDRRIQSQGFLSATDDLTSVLPRSALARRMTPEKVLTPQQIRAVGNVRDDLTRVQFADGVGSASGRAKGSDTAQNLGTEAIIGEEIGRSRLAALVQAVPFVRSAVSALNASAQRRVEAAVVEALANPQQARAILAAAPANERQIIEAVLARHAGAAGAAAVPVFQD